jgi:Mn-dependent DtxR family transcriptional regulator
MHGEIIEYLKRRKIPIKSKHIARKLGVDTIDIMPILNMLAQMQIIQYIQGDRTQKVDWGGWVLAR